MPNLEGQDSPSQPGSDLKQRVVRGGAAIAVRQGLGMGLSLVNVLLVTRIIGPSQYGVFAAAFGVVAFIATAGTLGLDVYLLRKPSEPDPAEYNQAFTLFAVISVFFGGGLTLLRHRIAQLAGIPELALPLAVMSLYIPFNLINVPAVVRLDRNLRFHRVALIELVGQVSGYLVAVPLAFGGKGCWAPILGTLTAQFLMLILVFLSAPMRLRLHWQSKLVRQMLGYGLGYSGAVWIWQLRSLVNPLIVGRFAGAQGVGFVALAIRLVEVLAFIRLATWRIAMAALAKLDGNRNRLRRSITEGMRLQALAVGVPLALFAGVAPFLLPPIFGSRWDPAFLLFPFIALSYLLNAAFNMHASVLFLLQRNVQVMYFYAAHIALFAGSAALLVPRFGYLGYGWAEIMAFASYCLLHHFIRLSVGSPDYRSAMVWLLVCSIVIVASSTLGMLRLTVLLLLPAPFFFARERTFLEVYARLLMNRESV
jgi:O-antigen/teichoic acid export membrane protein